MTPSAMRGLCEHRILGTNPLFRILLELSHVQQQIIGVGITDRGRRVIGKIIAFVPCGIENRRGFRKRRICRSQRLKRVKMVSALGNHTVSTGPHDDGRHQTGGILSKRETPLRREVRHLRILQVDGDHYTKFIQLLFAGWLRRHPLVAH
jgi:hypothetical protein